MKEEEDIPLSKDSEEPAIAVSSYPPIQVPYYRWYCI